MRFEKVEEPDWNTETEEDVEKRRADAAKNWASWFVERAERLEGHRGEAYHTEEKRDPSAQSTLASKDQKIARTLSAAEKKHAMEVYLDHLLQEEEGMKMALENREAMALFEESGSFGEGEQDLEGGLKESVTRVQEKIRGAKQALLQMKLEVEADELAEDNSDDEVDPGMAERMAEVARAQEKHTQVEKPKETLMEHFLRITRQME